MLRQIVPVFFTVNIPATLGYYTGKLGFECLGTWLDPPVYAIVARDRQVIHFRCAEPPTPNPDKYADELLDAYLFVEDADALYAEYAVRGVEFVRGLSNMPWHCREFVVKDAMAVCWPSARTSETKSRKQKAESRKQKAESRKQNKRDSSTAQADAFEEGTRKKGRTEKESLDED